MQLCFIGLGKWEREKNVSFLLLFSVNALCRLQIFFFFLSFQFHIMGFISLACCFLCDSALWNFRTRSVIMMLFLLYAFLRFSNYTKIGIGLQIFECFHIRQLKTCNFRTFIAIYLLQCAFFSLSFHSHNFFFFFYFSLTIVWTLNFVYVMNECNAFQWHAALKQTGKIPKIL